MSDQQIDQLIALIDSLISEGDYTWKQKRDRVLEQASHSSQTSLAEFASWFGD